MKRLTDVASFKRFVLRCAIHEFPAAACLLVFEFLEDLDGGGLQFLGGLSCAVGRNRVELIFLVVFGGRITFTGDFYQFLCVALAEVLVNEHNLVDAAGLLVEVVHIQLSLERVEIAVLVELGKHMLFKQFSTFDFERLTIICPMNYGLQILCRANLV